MAKQVGFFTVAQDWLSLIFGAWVYITLPLGLVSDAGLAWIAENAHKMSHQTYNSLAVMTDQEIADWLHKKGTANESQTTA